MTATRLVVDREGWTRISNALGEMFTNQEEEQEDARRRVGHATEELFRAGSMLISFELPDGRGIDLDRELAEGRYLMVPFAVRVSKVIEDEVCLQILDEANHGDTSVPLFYEKFGKRFGLSKDAIRRRFNKLLKYGWLRVVGHKTGGRRRGATENFYRATGPALYDEHEHGPWANPSELVDGVRRSGRPSSSSPTGPKPRWSPTRSPATRRPVWRGRSSTSTSWDGKGSSRRLKSSEPVAREQELAAVRLRESGEEPIEMAVALGAFDTPKPVKEH